MCLGFTLFQGRLLGTAETVETQEVSAGRFERLRLLKELGREEMDPDKIEEIIKRDPVLSYKLLMFVNSAATGLRQPITNIRQAVMMFGRMSMLRWASVVAMKDVGQSRPTELVRQALFRGRFCELLAKLSTKSLPGGEMFLLGLFSQIDQMLGREMEDVLALLPLTDDIKAAILGEPSDLRTIYDVCRAYESGDWGYVSELSSVTGLDESAMPALYQESLRWSTSIGG